MELFKSIIGVPYMFHCLTVSGVLVGAILLFVFGFRSTEEPSFNKIKADSKLNAKKKKAKDKKSAFGSGSPKTNVVGRAKTTKNDDKARKSGALKDSKNVNMDATRQVNEQSFAAKERKKKGKENVDVKIDSNDEEGGWERALSRKDRKNKKSLEFNQVLKRNSKELNYHTAAGAVSKKEYENMKTKSAQKEKKLKSNDGEDLGVWQEAKTGKKRRKIQKEA